MPTLPGKSSTGSKSQKVKARTFVYWTPQPPPEPKSRYSPKPSLWYGRFPPEVWVVILEYLSLFAEFNTFAVLSRRFYELIVRDGVLPDARRTMALGTGFVISCLFSFYVILFSLFDEFDCLTALI
jgi:hypothetical protein